MLTNNLPVRFRRLVWLTLVFNFLVIIWGGFVSASGSGDGCGASWPLCPNIVDDETLWQTVVEFTHRLTSGLALLLVVGTYLWSRRLWPNGSLPRKAAGWALIFMVIESLLGASLVLFQWVDTNESVARAFVQPVHLTNTLLLSGAIAAILWGQHLQSDWWARYGRLLVLALFGLVLVSSFGTFASLASTIFPSESFFEGVQKDFAGDSHYLVRLRIWHPALALLLGLGLWRLVARLEASAGARQLSALAWNVQMLYWLQFGLGALNAILLTPVWLQMVHLALAHLLWLGLVALAYRSAAAMADTSVLMAGKAGTVAG